MPFVADICPRHQFRSLVKVMTELGIIGGEDSVISLKRIPHSDKIPVKLWKGANEVIA